MKKTTGILELQAKEDLKITLQEKFRETEYFVLYTHEIQRMAHLATTVRYDAYTIILVLSGTCEMNINSVHYQIKKNFIGFRTPSSIREVTAVSEDFDALLFIGPVDFMVRTGVYYLEELTHRLFSLNNTAAMEASDAQAESLIFLLMQLRALSSSQSERFYREMTQNYFITILYELMEVYNDRNSDPPIRLSRREELVSTFLRLLFKSFRKERSLHFYAERLGVTSKYLSEVTKQLTGQTVGALIDEAVILEAKMMLAKPEATVNQVAADLHFSNQSAFGKFFKRYVGIAPTDYRVSQ